MSRPFNFASGEYYHLYNRGVDKRRIFLVPHDYERFTALLFLANGSQPVNLEEQGSTLSKVVRADRGEPLIAIGAYCLMPNHFHLLARELSDGGISKFMQKMTTGYTMYFNKSNERTGSLFQGKFKAEHAAEDRYLKYLFAYIHLNPAKLTNPRWREEGVSAKERKYLESYTYSSYQDYLGEKRDESAILTRAEFPGYFDDAGSFRKEMNDWLDYSQAG